MITVRQVNAARALLDWSREDLADSAGISYRTVARIEQTDGLLCGSRETRDTIFAAFRVAGVEFIPTGVQLAGQQKHRGEVIDHRRHAETLAVLTCGPGRLTDAGQRGTALGSLRVTANGTRSD
jgi:transcriptional regulator with XRE-family HTH domain